MDLKAFSKAQSKLERMQRSVAEIEAATTYVQVASAWESFIYAASTFYSTLQQGAKSKGTTNAWFGRKNHERRTDPLLKYIHQARNSEEHGIDAITAPANSKIHLTEQGSEVMLRSNGKFWEVISQSGEVVYPMDKARLVTVRDDRYKNVFDPPETHLGVAISDQSPLGVARLARSYMEAMLNEAATFL